ncbi:4-alpha-glucanotransferase [Candidatus Laterigemmans baculatus]|uniref:4-alpha-glucanotransferase n=1 Tax=Candidatus Laterigemmans baculatus TaxID=2770505 RepID=UPI0013DB5791|nr:4-alpha-glucanotransferase [Candidatus Laterigemmans baculatus]
MSENQNPQTPALLSPNDPAAGVLLHVTSLPSPYGIGDLGPAAIAWVDRLADAGQRWWQILPLGPTGLGNSPYDPLSTFAGNLHLLSPDWLIEDGLLEPSDCERVDHPTHYVDFDRIRVIKPRLAELAWKNFQSHGSTALREAFAAFCGAQAHWLNDYALFIALKERFSGASFYSWPHEFVRRDPDVIAQARQELAPRIEQARFGQFLFFRQWHRLREHAARRNVRILGDLPFFVSHDSSEVWAHPELFLLDANRQPLVAAGVPPDYFSATGQLWGNPIYDWNAMQRNEYRWWMNRLRALLTLVDAVRLDHFRAFAAAWHVPAGAPTAETGKWVPGPGADFFVQAQYTFGRLPFIAEDLGLITDDVRALRDAFHLPGMRVLQFAFDGDPDNLFLPHMYDENTAVFTGTHDNDTTRGWYAELPEKSRKLVRETLDRPDLDADEVAWALIETAWSSKAGLAIAPLQDLLNLGSDARMNIPGLAAGNWSWRVTEEMLDDQVFERLHELTRRTGREASAVPAR